MKVLLISSRAEIEPYVGAVRAAGDAARGSFGFLRKSAYEEFAAQGRMIIAVEASSRVMLGYTLYGGVMPQGKIFQTWAAPQARGKGVGRQLILEVVRRLEKFNFLSLRADVAQDLADANEFYAALNFETTTVRPAKTRGRFINVRVRELATPSLIELAADRADKGACLPISLPHTERAPLYVLDLNVLFDVARARSQASVSGKVFGAGLENDVRLAVSAELVVELERNTDPNAPDPILRFAASLPRLPTPPRQRHDALTVELAPAIFPDRAKRDRLTVRDRSDLTHLATAIHESAAGFVTSEKAILRAAETLREKYDLEVLSPAALGVSFETEAVDAGPIEVWARGTGVRAHPLHERDYEDAERFLIQRGVTTSECRAVLASGTGTLPRRRHVVRVDGAVAAVAAWEAPRVGGGGARSLHLSVDEGSPAAALASDYLIGRAITDVGAAPPSTFELTIRPGQSSARQAAIANGFFRVRGARTQTQILQKVAMARAVLPHGWSTFCESVRARAGMTLPKELPPFSSTSQAIEIASAGGECVTLTLGDLERLLSPLLLILPKRPAVILPITQRYAEELFSGSAQPGLLGGREAALRSVRGYIGGRGSYKTIPEGGLALFYESGRGGGRKAVTAVARITRKYLMTKESASQMLSEKAVLEAATVKRLGRGEQIVVTEFEDLMLLRTPVRLADLRLIGCVGGANFVTATPISAVQAIAIAQAGDPHV
jgi:GNAT superfamily N-acetyltransferase